MKKSSFLENKRVENIKALMKYEGLKQKDLAEILEIEPQNLSRSIVSGKISEKMCRKIGEHFPKYNIMWLMGDSDLILKEDVYKNCIAQSDARDNASLTLLDTALQEVCVREGIDVPELENIPEILLLKGQLEDFATSLMYNYVIHRSASSFWSTLDQELETIERRLNNK